jgi:hypothetical protein
MVELREAGETYEQISRHFAVRGIRLSAKAISWQCIRLGADRPDAKPTDLYARRQPMMRNGHLVRPFSEADDALLLELEAQGAPMPTIARRLGRRENSIRGRLYTLARHEARTEAAQ